MSLFVLTSICFRYVPHHFHERFQNDNEAKMLAEVFVLDKLYAGSNCDYKTFDVIKKKR